MNDNTQEKFGEAIIAAVLTTGAFDSADNSPKAVVTRYAQILKELQRSGGALAPNSLPH
jgi:hypothetical protein